MTKTRQILCAIAIGGAIGASLTQVAIARADEATYINDLALLDVPVTPVTLPLGHMICADISAHGVSGVDRTVRNGISSGVPDHQLAGIIVTAVQELCPSNIPAFNAWEAQH